MAEMQVNQLTVDLIQDSATVSLHKAPDQHIPGKMRHTGISISVPLETPGNQPESHLKQMAVRAATSALQEALRALERHPV